MSVAESLRIRIGPSPAKMELCTPNDEDSPGDILIRINNFRGVVPPGCPRIPTTPYFNGRKRLMSFQFQGRFTKEWSADDLIWSQDWDQPLNSPKMIGLFTTFWKMTDPGSYSEINNPTPYMRSYVVTGMCTLTAWRPSSGRGEEDDDEPELFRPILIEDVNRLLPSDALTKRTSAAAALKIPPSVLSSQLSGLTLENPPSGPGTPTVSSDPVVVDADDAENVDSNDSVADDGPVQSNSSGKQVGGTSRNLFRKVTNMQSSGLDQKQLALAKEIKLIEKMMGGGEDSVKERRKYFGVEENRKETIFRPDMIYGFEVFNPYFDPNEFKIKIPAITIDLVKVTNAQPMRMRLMSKDGRTVFFVVEVSVSPQMEDETSVSFVSTSDGTASSTLSKLWGRLTK
ncbi:hypothetical protein HDU82_006953 [Entophlyctis luteolus]|nr:hypothetical protein HDU82_006953 [Entophlyctis luteolus]